MTFLLGASTAAHQVEGNNTSSDFWKMEHMTYSDFDEPSGEAVDHYHRYEEDIQLLKQAGLNAYRFSIEWARIEPEEGKYDKAAVEHYRDVIAYCHQLEVEPVVTLHHFTSPSWLITKGGWEVESTIEDFKRYVSFVMDELGSQLHYICTINEANMGVQIAAIMKRYIQQMGLQVGMNFSVPHQEEKAKEIAEIFGLPAGVPAQTFLGQRSPKGDDIIMRSHQAAKAVIKEKFPDMQVGITLSLHDIQAADDSPKAQQLVLQEWTDEFLHYVPYIEHDDFLGVQNYTRTRIGKEGTLTVPEGADLTQMGYENYPEALANVVRTVAKDFHGKILVTENGIGTDDDAKRQQFIKTALLQLKQVQEEGIPVIGYLHWTLLDNFEWHKGFSKTFGLIAVDRTTQQRYPKESLTVLGTVGNQLFDTEI